MVMARPIFHAGHPARVQAALLTMTVSTLPMATSALNSWSSGSGGGADGMGGRKLAFFHFTGRIKGLHPVVGLDCEGARTAFHRSRHAPFPDRHRPRLLRAARLPGRHAVCLRPP